MSDAKHTPPGDTSFRTSLLRATGGALALIVLMAVVFGAIGLLGRADDDRNVASDQAGDTDEDAEGPDESAADPDIDTEEDAEDPDEAAEPPDDPPPADEATDEEPPPAAESEDDPDEAARGEGTDEDEAEAAEPPADRAFDPAEVSVQVLDGYRTDGGAAAGAVATTLREAGYRVVAQNRAVPYDLTTVLWTAGFEAQARQVAAEIGAAEVREQPGNLSTSVQVHVVVGADRG